LLGVVFLTAHDIESVISLANLSIISGVVIPGSVEIISGRYVAILYSNEFQSVTSYNFEPVS